MFSLEEQRKHLCVYSSQRFTPVPATLATTCLPLPLPPTPPSLSHYFCPSRETTLFLLHPSFPHFPSTGFLDNPQTSLPTTVCAFFFFLFSFFYASFHQPFPVSSNSLNTPLALRIPFHRVPALPPISQHPSSFSKISLHEYRYPWYFRSTEGVLSFLNFYPPPPSLLPFRRRRRRILEDSRGLDPQFPK